MEKKYTESFVLRTPDCDMCGQWRPSAILESMQETAGAHSALCDLDRDSMLSLGVVWVLSRLKVEMLRMPHVGEKITVETYPTPAKHLFFPRSHLFYDADGEKIGCANSLWVLMDINTRVLTVRGEIAEKLPDNRDLPSAAGMPASVRPLQAEAHHGQITPQFTELDVNGHVNNTKYLDWCCNALGIETMRNHALMRFDVNYDAEVLPGCEIHTELTRQEARFSFAGFHEGKRHFAISGELFPRQGRVK